MRTIIGYWSSRLAQDIAWDALDYRMDGQTWEALADAAVSVHQESEGIGFPNRISRDDMIRKVAHYAEVYWPEWQEKQALAEKALAEQTA